jgi:hypothetical protein
MPATKKQPASKGQPATKRQPATREKAQAPRDFTFLRPASLSDLKSGIWTTVRRINGNLRLVWNGQVLGFDVTETSSPGDRVLLFLRGGHIRARKVITSKR